MSIDGVYFQVMVFVLQEEPATGVMVGRGAVTRLLLETMKPILRGFPKRRGRAMLRPLRPWGLIEQPTYLKNRVSGWKGERQEESRNERLSVPVPSIRDVTLSFGHDHSWEQEASDLGRSCGSEAAQFHIEALSFPLVLPSENFIP